MNPYDKDYEKNVNLINFKIDYPLDREVFIGDSILMTGTSDYPWTYISLDNPLDLEKVMEAMRPEDDRIMIQDTNVLDFLADRYTFEWVMTCQKLIYRGPAVHEANDVYVLKPEDAAYIQSMNDYGDFTDVAYIKTRIEKGIGLGIKMDHQLVAWVLTHDDGAIGFIKVLEGYRNKGYAKLLTHEVIRRQQAQGQLSFVHIEADNIKSINLAKKVGFEPYGQVHWVKLGGKRDDV